MQDRAAMTARDDKDAAPGLPEHLAELWAEVYEADVAFCLVRLRRVRSVIDATLELFASILNTDQPTGEAELREIVAQVNTSLERIREHLPQHERRPQDR
jgi:hypothetical protein